MAESGRKIITYIICFSLLVSLCACGEKSEEKTDVTLNKEDTTLVFSIDEMVGTHPVQIPEYHSKVQSEVVSELNQDIKDLLLPIYEQEGSEKEPQILTTIYDNDRYLQAVVQYVEYPLVGGNGDVTSYNYDRIKDKRVTLTDALILSQTTLDDVRQMVIDAFLLTGKATENETAIYGVTVDGFVLDEKDACVFFGNIDLCFGNDTPWSYVYAYDYTSGTVTVYDLQ